MKAPLAEREMELLRRVAQVQEEDLVSFCIEFDLVPDEPFRVDDVVDRVFEALVDRARVEGLPISRYDAEDLSGFAPGPLAAFAAGLGVKTRPGDDSADIIADIVLRMRRATRRLPRNSQIPFFLPYFLPALVRYFSNEQA